jgi:hypothetical protein
MAFNLTEVDEFTPHVSMPEDGIDPRNAATLQSGLQALANRTNYLGLRMGLLTPKLRTKRYAFGDGLGSVNGHVNGGGGDYSHFASVGYQVLLYNPPGSGPEHATQLAWSERLRLPVGATLKGYRARFSASPNTAGLTVTARVVKSPVIAMDALSGDGPTATLSESVLTEHLTAASVLGSDVVLDETIVPDRFLSLSLTITAESADAEWYLRLFAYELTFTEPPLGAGY